jgi:hypothetical protein
MFICLTFLLNVRQFLLAAAIHCSKSIIQQTQSQTKAAVRWRQHVCSEMLMDLINEMGTRIAPVIPGAASALLTGGFSIQTRLFPF